METKLVSQAKKAQLFKSLHERPGCFVIPNAWNGGSAKILTAMGFEALATTSAGLAFSLGCKDGTGEVTREDNLANASEIMLASPLPLSCDFENGYSDSTEGVGRNISLAASAGLVSASIEDATGHEDHPIYELEEATERVRAAVEAANKLSFPFLITARAENFLHGRPDLKDTIKRLQRFQQAGAHVLFAPGLKQKQEIASVLKEIDRPLNVLMGFGGSTLTMEELTALGVRRVSVGSAFCRAAFGAFIQAAKEIKEKGSFQFAENTISYKELSDMF